MKKIIIPIGVILVLSITACRKDYSCSCSTISTTTIQEPNTEPDITIVTSERNFEVKEAKTHQAKAACNEATITRTDITNWSSEGGTHTVADATTCTLSK
jgi:hypothetical protein